MQKNPSWKINSTAGAINELSILKCLEMLCNPSLDPRGSSFNIINPIMNFHMVAEMFVHSTTCRFSSWSSLISRRCFWQTAFILFFKDKLLIDWQGSLAWVRKLCYWIPVVGAKTKIPMDTHVMPTINRVNIVIGIEDTNRCSNCMSVRTWCLLVPL